MRCHRIGAALVVVAGLALSGTPALAGPFSATDATFGSFDSSSGTRLLTIGSSATITDVDISIVFAKCDDPSLGAGAALGAPCIGTGFSFDNEIVFRLSHGATTVNLVNENTFSGQTPGAGVIRIHFDDSGAALPGLLVGGTFHPSGNLSAFNGLDALGDWTLFIQDTVGADRLDYFSSCLSVNGDTACPSSAATVPEPATFALLGTGLGLALAARRRAGRTN